jgi:hypothetical protein
MSLDVVLIEAGDQPWNRPRGEELSTALMINIWCYHTNSKKTPKRLIKWCGGLPANPNRRKECDVVA